MDQKANATQNATAPAELFKLAVQAVKHKATIDDTNVKKRQLRETLVRLQEALEARRAEERRIAEAWRREEEEAARLAAEEEARRRAEEERLAAEAEAEESESEEEDEEPEPEQAPEADEEVSSEEEEEDADELMPEPTLRGRVAPGMVPFMARATARPMPPAPRRKALQPPPRQVVAVTPDSESEEEEEPVKSESDEASAEEIESEDEEEPEDEVEEEDAIVEVTRWPARRGYAEPVFEGIEALRTEPIKYHELAAALASAGASIEGEERPLLDFRRDLITSARVAPVTVTVHHSKRDRDIEIDEDGDIAAQTAAAVHEIRAATQALTPIKTKLRAFEGQKVSVPGGRVAIGVSKEAVYGYAIFVDRGVWNKLDEETQDACVDAGLIKLKGAAAASVALTVRDIGEAPPVPRKRAAPARKKPVAKKGKLSAVVRAKRGVTYYK